LYTSSFLLDSHCNRTMSGLPEFFILRQADLALAGRMIQFFPGLCKCFLLCALDASKPGL